MVPVIFFYTIFDIFKWLFQATKEFYVPMMVNNGMYLASFIPLYIFVVIFELDLIGIGLGRGGC